MAFLDDILSISVSFRSPFGRSSIEINAALERTLLTEAALSY